MAAVGGRPPAEQVRVTWAAGCPGDASALGARMKGDEGAPASAAAFVPLVAARAETNGRAGEPPPPPAASPQGSGSSCPAVAKAARPRSPTPPPPRRGGFLQRSLGGPDAPVALKS